jgi:plasmid maintenance system antidote protein VapI
MARKRIPAVHPGAYLKELMGELTLSQHRLAKDIGVPAKRIHYTPFLTKERVFLLV